MTHVYPLTTVHMLVEDEAGEIRSAYGTMRVLCGSKSKPNELNDVSWSSCAAVITCRQCLELLQPAVPETVAVNSAEQGEQ